MFFVIIFLLGVVFGSFIAAWVSRAHREMSVWFGRSECVSCSSLLQARDLIPIVSFLMLKGKCRNCSNKISSHYFLTELFFGVGLVFLAWFHQVDFFSLSFDFIFQALVLFFFTAIFVSDFLYQEIPFSLTVPAVFLLFVLSLLWGTGDYSSMIFGAIIAGGFFLIQFVVSKGKWIGFGDVALGILMGVILGWQKTLLALFFAYVVGAVLSVILLAFKKANRKTALPFGVFLNFGTFVAMLWGEKFIDWYLKFL